METVIQLNSGAKLSPHLASPSVAALSNLSELNCVRLSPHFTLGELTKTSHKVYNIPSHEAIENLKRVCSWLEYLRKRYNELYQTTPGPSLLFKEGKTEGKELPSSWETARLEGALATEGTQDRQGVEEKTLLPIIINSGYRSPQLNKKIGGQPNSNHLTGCAVDIRVKDNEQLIVYAAILIQYANETQQDFDELLLEKNKHGAIWLHFAVKPKENRRHVMFLTA